MRERKNRICARSRGRIFERSHHRQHHEAEHHLARLRLVLGHQRRGRMGRRVPVSSDGVPNHRDRVLVLPRAIARVLVQLLRQRPGIVLLPRPHAHIHRTAGHHALPFGWCCLIAAIYLDAWALPLVVSGGALLGLGSAGFYMLWQRLFASQDSDTGNRDLIKGTLYAAVLYFSLYLIPQAVTAFLIPLVFLPLFGLTIVLKSREIDLDQAMFQDVPRDHPLVYQRLVNDYWAKRAMRGRAGVLHGHHALPGHRRAGGGITRERAVDGRIVDRGYIAAGAVAAQEPQRERGGRYRVFFPFVITSFLLLPFLPEEYARWLAGGLYAVYSVAIMLMMIQCAQASRDRGINPVFIYGSSAASCTRCTTWASSAARSPSRP